MLSLASRRQTIFPLRQYTACSSSSKPRSCRVHMLSTQRRCPVLCTSLRSVGSTWPVRLYRPYIVCSSNSSLGILIVRFSRAVRMDFHTWPNYCRHLQSGVLSRGVLFYMHAVTGLSTSPTYSVHNFCLSATLTPSFFFPLVPTIISKLRVFSHLPTSVPAFFF